MIQLYRTRLSGPLLDRIDLQVEMPRVPHSDLADTRPAAASIVIREHVEQARDIQEARFQFTDSLQSTHGPKQSQAFCRADTAGQDLLKQVTDRLGFFARTYAQLKVSRTIADLAGSESIAVNHLAEAIQYRSLDRQTTTSG